MDYIQPRHKTLAFYGVPKTGSDTGDVTYTRMRKFTQLTKNKNPKEYTRQYVDEATEQTDVVGYAEQIDYGFDKHRNLAVQKDMIQITDREYVAENAVRTIIWVDTETGEAIKRDYSVIPGSEGDGTDIYKYSGSLKARGEAVFGTATSMDDWNTITFTEEDSD